MFMVVAGATIVFCALHVHGTSCKDYLKTLKRDKKPLANLSADVLGLPWLIYTVILLSAFVQSVLRKPCATDAAFWWTTYVIMVHGRMSSVLQPPLFLRKERG